MLCHVHAFSGGRTEVFIGALRKNGAISVLVRNRTTMLGLAATIAHIRSLGKAIAFLFLKVLTMLVTQAARGTLSLTDDDLVAYVGPFATEASGTEVMRIVEYTIGMYIVHPVELHFLGYGSGILA